MPSKQITTLRLAFLRLVDFCDMFPTLGGQRQRDPLFEGPVARQHRDTGFLHRANQSHLALSSDGQGNNRSRKQDQYPDPEGSASLWHPLRVFVCHGFPHSADGSNTWGRGRLFRCRTIWKWYTAKFMTNQNLTNNTHN